MHVLMEMLRGIPDTCVVLGTSSVLIFLYCAQKQEGPVKHTTKIRTKP
jgi:hypothetical protein